MEALPTVSLPSDHQRDAVLTLASVEALAEVTAKHLNAERLPEAVSLLREALAAYDEDKLAHGESPPSMMACSAIHLLLCAVLSRGGCHDLAYQEAQAAASKMDEVWGDRLLRAGSDRAAALREFLRAPPPWLVRAVELAVQARQCAATELEFMKDWELEEEGRYEGRPAEQLYRRLWEQIAQLHTEAVQLASQLLETGHPVRESTERALQQWLSRGPDEDPQSLPAPARAQTPVLAGMLAGQSGPAEEDVENVEHGWQMLAPARGMPSLLRGPKQLTRHERLNKGLCHPENTVLNSRRKRAPVDLLLGSSGEMSSTFRSAASSSMMCTQSSVGPQPSLVPSKSDTYLRGAAKEMLQTSPNWSNRRVPIFFSCAGTGGKAGWALRGAPRQTQRSAAVKDSKADPFSDWLKATAGPQRSLGAQVIASDGYMRKFHMDLAEKSRKFKHFWMKDEVHPDHLLDDRVRFSEEGIRIFNKSARKFPKPDPRDSWPQGPEDRPLSGLFAAYGVQHDKKKGEHGLKSLGLLLNKSNHNLRKAEAKARKAERLGSKQAPKESKE